MAVRVDASGKVYQLDRAAEPDEVVSEEDAKDVVKLARLLMRLLKDVASVKRRFFPRRVTYANRAVTSGDTMRLHHGFGVHVEYWIVKWRPTTPGDAPLFDYSDGTTANMLALDVGNSGTVSIRVESGG